MFSLINTSGISTTIEKKKLSMVTVGKNKSETYIPLQLNAKEINEAYNDFV